MVVIAMLAGPSVAGVLTAGLFLGRPGLRGLWRRFLHWRAGPQWYATALLIAPLTVAGVLAALSLASPVFRPGILTVANPGTHLVLGIATGLAAGFFEELGWTGLAIPRLRLRYGILTTGLIVGLVWGAWHLLVVWWGSTSTSGSLPMSLYLPAMTLAFLPPYRILMVWVYDRTNSLVVAMLMHASLTASVRIFDPVPIAGAPIVIYNLLLGAAVWIMVLGIAIAFPGAFRHAAAADAVKAARVSTA